MILGQITVKNVCMYDYVCSTYDMYSYQTYSKMIFRKNELQKWGLLTQFKYVWLTETLL